MKVAPPKRSHKAFPSHCVKGAADLHSSGFAGSIESLLPNWHPRRALMEWTTPSFVEIKMDAEIGSYQVDDEPNIPIVETDEDQRAAE